MIFFQVLYINCGGEVHMKLTFCGAEKNRKWEADADSSISSQRLDLMVPLNCSQCIRGSVDATDRCKPYRNSGPPFSSSVLHFISANTQSSPSLCSSTPTDTLRLPPSCHTTHKNEVRSKAHIRRAGGSTLSGVRNNSFWPSRVLKWSPPPPRVAAYQRAAAIEWVVDITQPGIRTYTGHSKRPSSLSNRARSCFDWDRVQQQYPGFYDASLWEPPALKCNTLCKKWRWSLQSVMEIYLSALNIGSVLKRKWNNK